MSSKVKMFWTERFLPEDQRRDKPVKDSSIKAVGPKDHYYIRLSGYFDPQGSGYLNRKYLHSHAGNGKANLVLSLGLKVRWPYADLR